MIVWTSCAQVSRNVPIGGGTLAAISAISSSGIGPGPLGIADTKPIAEAPYRIASFASSTLAMQQIFILGFVVGAMENGIDRRGAEGAEKTKNCFFLCVLCASAVNYSFRFYFARPKRSSATFQFTTFHQALM